MQKAIIGKKIGMTQIFDEKGNVVPVTVVEAGPCVVVQKKTVENDGYAAIQLGYGDLRPAQVNKPMQGHFAKADVAAKRTLREFRLTDCDALNVGDVVDLEGFLYWYNGVNTHITKVTVVAPAAVEEAVAETVTAE